MSNYLAIATVTELLGQTVLKAAEGALGKEVKLNKSRPEDLVGIDTVSVYLYLYQVTPNSALRNDDLPNRSADGRLVRKPQTALDLHYLIAFYGDDSELEPQRMLGAVVRDINARSVLTREQIRKGIEGIDYLDSSNLADATELVKFTQTVFSLEEASKLWSILLQTKHALSVTYQGSVVLIESDETPQQALPVSERGVSGIPFSKPDIKEVRVLDDDGNELPENAAIELGARLLIKGQQLQGQITQVLLDGIEIPTEALSDTEILLTPLTTPLPDGSNLRAGVKRLQIVHQIPLGDPAVAHSFNQSDVYTFPLRPTLTVSMVDSNIRVEFTLPVGRSQRVVLSLNELTDNPRPSGYRLDAPKNNGIPESNDPTEPIITETGVVDFQIQDIVASGTYLVRVQVDGAESMLHKADNGKYDQPQVVVP
ncbi:DUF4255 domain-containing protein [Methylomonas sp. MgM2]